MHSARSQTRQKRYTDCRRTCLFEQTGRSLVVRLPLRQGHHGQLVCFLHQRIWICTTAAVPTHREQTDKGLGEEGPGCRDPRGAAQKAAVSLVPYVGAYPCSQCQPAAQRAADSAYA